ncbi:hypothetical protein Lgee_0308 [Legionella geestiana]|uniref:Uncharacterized protein n=1 Tax=Legionella geestiana TaxID=45065 RepID=A0A0W0U8E4_9GAMM|nr:hypothetical protein [Legionella geestiana]KTD04065.1 hypothetical protein Lgee_0308 [Legionella geestiana]QBS12079.1 hypothetical protein E4T54_04600 [Legionella geestiana]QDQ40314.1 hypothetical protein E3226_007855 [Legionella geestiana]STX53200.1 Uncharacterised protein [Legionella geestiana]
MRTGLFWDAQENTYWVFDIAENGAARAYRADRRADNPAYCGSWRLAEFGARELHPLQDTLESFGFFALEEGRLWHGITARMPKHAFNRAACCTGISAQGTLCWQQVSPSNAPQLLQYPVTRPFPNALLPLSPDDVKKRWTALKKNTATFAIQIPDSQFFELQEAAAALLIPADAYPAAEDWLRDMEEAFTNPNDARFSALNDEASRSVDCPVLAAKYSGSGILFMLKKWVLIEALTAVCNRVREAFGYPVAHYGAPLRQELDAVLRGLNDKEAHVAESRRPIFRAVRQAQQNYSNWFYHRIGGRGGETWCTRLFRHTESGQRLARAFVDNYPIAQNEDLEIAYVNSFLREWRRNWHRHSFSAFLMDALCTIPNTPWSFCCKELDNRYCRQAVFTAIDSFYNTSLTQEGRTLPSAFDQYSISSIDAF